MESTQLHARPSSELMKIDRTVSASREALLGDGARIWVVRKIRHMIEAAPGNLTPVAYTDHIATINLATSLSSASPDRPFVCICII
ncbi:hypothetical protein N7489_002497 [Penicillium chrysogenum]|uniref:Uncharacterized protein n=1 Tax=Penicillium chrysogenum TaxID=5076 RepID=A0ABQ8WMH6_PENCH|nr:uncharacterized protein N7489_002497 [Penicillium chrysogenum]KAJ5248177.1 hypothetical protein N7524_012137 [Penicillium chrysogenum]KAJ5252087.1 hypothetical protein N7489_002497 [Penicillium chrysogenum]KAJ5270991.1 hypothetical protein N7505_006749 [Penicillium chrysogenum]KAJ6146255.1 hypothetical protein N7497_008237 [Penicillium chrysogenum]